MKRFNVRVSIINPGFIKTPMTDENNYTMPMIKSPEYAANQIYKGLVKSNDFEIHFPKKFTFLMKILKILPSSLYFRIVKFGLKTINY
jgi:short-subunit dehydrogenase